MLVWFVSVYAILLAIFNFPISVTLIEFAPRLSTPDSNNISHNSIGKNQQPVEVMCAATAFTPATDSVSVAATDTDDAASFGDFVLALVVTVLGPVCASQWLMSVANALNSVKCITILPCCSSSNCFGFSYSCNWAHWLAPYPIYLLLLLSLSIFLSAPLQANHRNSFTPRAALACVWLIDGRFVCSFPFVLLLFLL